MKIILAFDSFKGAVSAVEACKAAATGLSRCHPSPEIVLCPLSDGGEGFAESIHLAAGGTLLPVTVTGPRFHRTHATILLLNDARTAILESAQACGLGLVPLRQRSAMHTTSYGLGEMIQAAIDAGVEHLIVGLGGSATNDGGMGMLTALGWQFIDHDGHRLPPIGASLRSVARIIPPADATLPCRITAACDVTAPLYGPQGAAFTFARQKGASESEVVELDRGLQHFAEVTCALLGRDTTQTAGAGAAGGIGFALLAYLGAEFHSGAGLALQLTRFHDHLHGASLCITGEGQTDWQTAQGKLPAAVATASQRAGIPCVCLSGALGQDWQQLYDHHFTALFSIGQRPQTVRQAMRETDINLADATEAVYRLYQSAMHIQVL